MYDSISAKLKRIIKTLIRFVAIGLGYPILAGAPYIIIIGYYYDSPLSLKSWYICANIIFSIHNLFAYYSLVRHLNIFHFTEEKIYIESCKYTDFKESALYHIRQKQFWIGLFSLCVLLYFIPNEFCTSSFAHLIFGNDLIGIKKVFLILMLFPFYLLLTLLAKHSATKEYRKNIGLTKRQLIIKELYLSILLWFCYFAGGVVIGYIIPTVIAYIPLIIQALSSIPAIILYVFITLLILGIYCIGIIKRIRVIKKIQKRVKSIGYSISEIKSPIKSLFAVVDGESFNIKKGDKIYSCKIISGFNKSTPILLYENEKGCYEKTIRIMKRVYFGTFYRHFSFDYKTKGLKILIVNPTPKKVLKVIDSRRFELDNGDTVGNCKIFTANSFLNALDRDCIER